MQDERRIVAVLNCHDDDVFCFRKEIIDDLVDNGYTVLVSCPYGKRLEEMRRDNVIFENVDIDRRGTNPRKDYLLYRHYIKLFKKYKPIIVLSFTIKPNIYGGLAAKRLGIPYVNNITGLGSGYENGGIVKQIILTMYRVVLNSAYFVLFQNETNKNKIIDTGIVRHSRYEVIPGSGVNLQRFYFSDYPTTKPIVFNYIGRVMKDKNIDDYLYLAKHLHDRYPDVVFNVIGFIEKAESHYEAELHDLESQGVIRYLGAHNDVRPFIKDSYAIIHPSTYGEGLSNVLLESAAMGRVLITTSIPGCKETVVEGVNGYLFEPNNREKMIEVVDRFINLPWEQKAKMGLQSRVLTERRFSREIVVNKYRELVKSI